MQPERWRQIERLCHAALERPASERQAFLATACGGDEELRRQVESLLSHEKQAEKFMETPAVELAAQALAEGGAGLPSPNEVATSLAGRTIDHYRILEKLGGGGMGVVYKAEDTKLHRFVALKFLPEEWSKDRQALERFQREARAAAALNHPNILAVFQMGTYRGAPYLVSELLEGETLREQMKRGAMPARKVMDYAVQMARGLATAHEKGIVHRDLKPENLFATRDGRLKILDFGLAKLLQRKVTASSTLPTLSHETELGVVMGTVGYMSPEQVRGQATDARSDIFSFGAVLYEMLTGKRAFQRPTSADTLSAILNEDPPGISQLLPAVPPGLERVVHRCLEKHPEQRFQSASDLGFALDSLSDLPGEREVRKSSEGKWARMRIRVATLAVAAAVVLIAAFALYRLVGLRPQGAPFRAMRFTQLTTSGKAGTPAISPDGKYVAYVSGEPGDQSLWVRQVATRSDIQIVPAAEVTYGGLTFSHDGNYIYYVDWRKSAWAATAYRVPTLGGESRKVVDNIIGVVTLSPDDQRLAFVRSRAGDWELIVANSDGSGERKVAARNPAIPSAGGPAWSPDGRVIAVGVGSTSAYGVSIFDVEGGREKALGSQHWSAVDRLAWLPDGSGLIMDAYDSSSGQWVQLWELTYPGGEARRITNDLSSYNDVGGITTDSHTLVTMRYEPASSVWIAPAGDPGRGKQIASSSDGYDGIGGLAWTLDGKLIYFSAAGGNPDFWIMQADGGHARPLATGPGYKVSPSACSDGRTIIFASLGAIWRIDTDGGKLRQLAQCPMWGDPSCSPDSKSVVFSSVQSGKWILWKVSIDGGNPTVLTDLESRNPTVSPDGKWIACIYYADKANYDHRKIAIIPFEGGPPAKIVDFQRASVSPLSLDGGLKWTPDGHALTYLDFRKGASNIWRQPLDGGPPKQLTDFDKGGQVLSFAWSRDGRQLAMARGTSKSDVVLITNSK
jgi:eukaryotic-like serine/threonine-protein kinase